MDFFFFKVSSNFHMVKQAKQKSSSHEEWENYNLENAVLTPFSTKQSQKSLTVVPKTVSFKKKKSAINTEYLCGSLENKYKYLTGGKT